MSSEVTMTDQETRSVVLDAINLVAFLLHKFTNTTIKHSFNYTF